MESLIRPEFVIQYYDRTGRDRRLRNQLIDDRNTKHQSLNRHYGIVEADGSVPIGKRGHADPNYARQYDSIEAEFRPLYDGVTEDHDKWLRENNITIFEYLLFDNCMDEMEALAKKAVQREGHFYDAINLKADEFVGRLKDQYRIGGIKKKIEFEIQIHSYARRRCRVFFNIGFFAFSQQFDIYSFGNQWKTALFQSLDSLSAN